MQEQLWNQLVQALQTRANLSPEQAQQVANVVSEFAQQHAQELVQMAAGEGAGGMASKIGGMFNRG